MTAPPDWIFAHVVLRDGAGHPLCGTWGASSEELDDIKYVPFDGPTMQAAIAAAEARGREQGLREAIQAVLALSYETPARHAHIMAQVHAAILALIPPPPSPVASSRGDDPDNKEPTDE